MISEFSGPKLYHGCYLSSLSRFVKWLNHVFLKSWTPYAEVLSIIIFFFIMCGLEGLQRWQTLKEGLKIWYGHLVCGVSTYLHSSVSNDASIVL